MPDESGSVRPVVVFAVVAAAGGPAVSAVSVAAAEASRDARLCARRERRRGSGEGASVARACVGLANRAGAVNPVRLG